MFFPALCLRLFWLREPIQPIFAHPKQFQEWWWWLCNEAVAELQNNFQLQSPQVKLAFVLGHKFFTNFFRYLLSRCFWFTFSFVLLMTRFDPIWSGVTQWKANCKLQTSGHYYCDAMQLKPHTWLHTIFFRWNWTRHVLSILKLFLLTKAVSWLNCLHTQHYSYGLFSICSQLTTTWLQLRRAQVMVAIMLWFWTPTVLQLLESVTRSRYQWWWFNRKVFTTFAAAQQPTQQPFVWPLL